MAEVWLLQRALDFYPWKIVAGPMPAVVGRNGVGWGCGEPELPNAGKGPRLVLGVPGQ